MERNSSYRTRIMNLKNSRQKSSINKKALKTVVANALLWSSWFSLKKAEGTYQITKGSVHFCWLIRRIVGLVEYWASSYDPVCYLVDPLIRAYDVSPIHNAMQR